MTWSDGELSSPYVSAKRSTCLDRRPAAKRITPPPDVAASLMQRLRRRRALVTRLQRERSAGAMQAGGVALHMRSTARFFQARFTDIFIQPSAGDAGTLVACAIPLHQVLGIRGGCDDRRLYRPRGTHWESGAT